VVSVQFTYRRSIPLEGNPAGGRVSPALLQRTDIPTHAHCDELQFHRPATSDRIKAVTATVDYVAWLTASHM
jgi:hypothetical protein